MIWWKIIIIAYFLQIIFFENKTILNYASFYAIEYLIRQRHTLRGFELKELKFQADLGIEVILKLFSKDGLKVCLKLHKVSNTSSSISDNWNVFMLCRTNTSKQWSCYRFFARKNPTLALQICQEDYLPEALDLHN
jgi:hypothetical protein